MKLNSYRKYFSCILIFILITLLSVCAIVKENNKIASITMRMSTNKEWTDFTKTPYMVTFNKGDTMQVNYKSTVKSGTLLLKLVDSQGNLIYGFDTGKKGKKEIKIEKTDIYEIFVEGDKLKGSYEIMCSKIH